MTYINPYHTTSHLLHIIKLANAKADIKVQAEASSWPGLICHRENTTCGDFVWWARPPNPFAKMDIIQRIC